MKTRHRDLVLIWEVIGSNCGRAGLSQTNFQLPLNVMLVRMRTTGSVGSILEKELLVLFKFFYSGIKEQKETKH